ncbi:MAG: ABC transporter permease [Planctomycetota bacterium]
MNAWQLIRASLWHYRRVHLAVAAGVAVATAVITGALVVGDSVRGSLRGLALDRLGQVDSVLTAGRPFRDELGKELAQSFEANEQPLVVPAILTRGALTLQRDGNLRRSSGLNVLAAPGGFWGLRANQSAPDQQPQLYGNQLALTANVAEELAVAVGDTVLLKIPRPGSSPAESVLGDKLDATASRRLEVAAVLPNDGLANFSVAPSQQRPRNVFVPLVVLQDVLDLPRRANALLIAGNGAGAASDSLRGALKPKLTDYGLTVEEETAADGGRVAVIASDRLVLPSHVVATAEKVFADSAPLPVVTYLANTIEAGGKSIPYSTVTGIESRPGLGPLLDKSGQPIPIAEDEVVLNDWAADALGVAVGDDVGLTYYEPETTHGRLEIAEPLRLKLKAVVPLQTADGAPARIAAATFTPTLPGVTDQDSINDWDLPFELVEPIGQADEDYWNDYRTTPKAFVSLPLARRLWQTRWGDVSLLRLPLAEGDSAEGIAARLAAELDPNELGMQLLPVKAQALQAASGTTPFEGLFLGFSFFLMASAVMLIVLLFRLGVDGRAKEFGLLGAAGLTPAKQLRYAGTEAAVVAAVGTLVGVPTGVAYARVMIYGLSTWWVEATVVPFLSLHTPPRSLLIGGAIGFAFGVAASLTSLRKLLKLPPGKLLAGTTEAVSGAKTAARVGRTLRTVLLAGAAALSVAAFTLEGEAQAGAFFGSGALVLAAMIAWLRAALRRPEDSSPTSFAARSLAAITARRNPGRTLLAVGLTSVACFLIVAISAFRLAPTEAGTGGFGLYATADLPIVYDPAAEAGREQLGLGNELGNLLADARVRGFRVHDGEDASCLNLYQTAQPTVLGVPESLAEGDRFGWASTAKLFKQHRSPWDLLGSDLGKDDRGEPVVPVVLDKNTAAYSLHLGGVGSRLTIRDAADNPVTLEVVALLAGSVLQGKLMVSDAWFVRLFPETAGRRLFLVDGQAAKLGELLEAELSDFGLDAIDANALLARFLAVQNTYLSTFQSLGGLGLLLGTVGLAIAQLRSVVERRGELALLRAVGFTRSQLGRLVLSENLVLLLVGLAFGCLAALAAVLPHAFTQEAAAPWGTLAVLLTLVAVSGVAASWLAVRTAVRAPLVPALRGD